MASPSRQTLFKVSPVAGQKRAAPSLLPAFEPAMPSPKLPRIDRSSDASSSHGKLERGAPLQLPSAPTSCTVIPTSSPPSMPNTRRAGLQRTVSALTERAPLAAVPSIELDESGEPTLMGRSTNASDYQLSTNKLISRVHVRATYIAASASEPKKLLIECTGWNGVKVHCQGKAWELSKGDTFTSETEDVDIMIDVQDARVMVTWPKQAPKVLTPSDSDGTWDSENSPSRLAVAREAGRGSMYTTSPLRRQQRLHSPISPSAAAQAAAAAISGRDPTTSSLPAPVQIYEDEPAEENVVEGPTQPTQSTQIASQPLKESLSTEADSFSDNDEENDPVVHSFGPFGANIGGRFETFKTSSPDLRKPLRPLKEASISPQRLQPGFSPKRLRPEDAQNLFVAGKEASTEKDKDIITFAINHLMYSQLSATPLSTLQQHVQAHLKSNNVHPVPIEHEEGKDTFPSSQLQSLLEGIPCIGVVHREGKDAAGKRLESEYYYIPEQDDDLSRREVVQDLGIGGRGLRNCRKSHKQYFWRKPK